MFYFSYAEIAYRLISELRLYYNTRSLIDENVPVRYALTELASVPQRKK